MQAMTAASGLRGAVLRLLPQPPVTRFAPSPTGYLHLGHVVNAVFVWGLARATGGRVHLRLEDHDRVRCRALYEAACLDDLAWLGFVPDTGLHPLDRQSDRDARYTGALATLGRQGLVYACGCSRREIGGARYDGRCRTRGLEREPGRTLRVRIDEEPASAVDLRHGLLTQRPAGQCGDVAVRDRDGHWTYQFAVTVDDLDQGITLVIRGDDLLDSTGRQVALARLLGRGAPPLFLHHPLILAASGEKLSKSAGGTGVRSLRAAGVPPEEVVGRAASAVGLAEPGTRIRATEVQSLFGG